jgi:transposase, IS5 family
LQDYKVKETLANWFDLADEACEDALYDVTAFGEFCRIDLGRQSVSDATTLLNLRHLLDKHELGAARRSMRCCVRQATP